MNAPTGLATDAAITAYREKDFDRAIELFRQMAPPLPAIVRLHYACLLAVRGSFAEAQKILHAPRAPQRDVREDEIPATHSCMLLEDILGVIAEGRPLDQLHFRKRNRLLNRVFPVVRVAIAALGLSGRLLRRAGFPDGQTLEKLATGISGQCWIYGLPAAPSFVGEPLRLSDMADAGQIGDAFRKSFAAYLDYWVNQGHPLHNLMRAIVKPGDAHALYGLVRKYAPANIVEIGTFTGFSTSILAQAVVENGKGRIHCFDPNLAHVEVVKPLSHARALWSRLGVGHLIEVHEGFFSDPQDPALQGPPVHGLRVAEMLPPVDFAFIDGSHVTVDVLSDFRLLLPALADDAVLVFHDVKSWHSVRAAIEIIMSDEVWREWLDYHDIDSCGLDGVGVMHLHRRRPLQEVAVERAPAASGIVTLPPRKEKVCILGLDGLSWHVFDNFAGRLPHLSRIRERGTWADLETVNPPVTAPAWVSFQTAQNVGNHGVTSFEKYDDQFRYSLRDGSTLDATTYYEMLDQLGYRQLLVNVPYSNPARIAGDIVHSWLTFRPRPEQMVEPSSLLDEYADLRPYLAFNAFAPEGSARFYDELVAYTKHQFGLLREAMARKQYDAVFCLNSATDGLQHAAYFDIRDRNLASPGYRAMERTLTIIDDFAGWLMHEDPSCNIVLASDHGFQAYQGSFYVNQFLEREGYLAYSDNGSTVDQAHKSGGLIVGRILIRLRNHPLLLGTLKAIYARFFKRLVKFDYLDVIDLERTVAYMPSPAEMMIHMPVRAPFRAEDAERVAAEIIGKINALGIPVRAVSSIEAFGPSRSLQQIPPVVLLSDTAFIRKDIGTDIFRPDEVHAWHSRRGLFAGYGPAFRENCRLDHMHITEVIPTLFAGLGVPLSESFDGAPKMEALRNPASPGMRDYAKSPVADYEMSPEEREKVAQRLRDLGYL